jgi:hypothetical protein
MEDKVRILFLVSITFILIFSCGTSKGIESSPGEDDRETTILVDNPTVYDVYIESKEMKKIGKRSNNNKVTLLVEDGTLSGGFNILYEIPLSNSVTLFYKGDHRVFRENQTSFIIAEPHPIENYGTFITLHNRVNNAVRFFSGGTANSAWVQTGNPAMGNNLTRSDKREFDPNETVVFRIEYDSGLNDYSIRDGSKPYPLVIPQNVRNNYCYSFEYSKDGVTLTDSRPLYRVGEPAWAKTINNAAGPMPLAAADSEINLFASTNSGVIRNVYDSAGNVKGTVRNGDGFFILYAGKAENGFLVAGYERLANREYRPVARIHNMDGSMRYALKQSDEYTNVSFFTAAQKDNSTWLLAGDGMNRGVSGNTAYARMVQVKNDELIAIWERSPDIKCGDIKAAVYDTTRDCWFVTGESLEIAGSYIARIGVDGKIQKIDHLLKDMSFYKILIDTQGVCYLAGEEKRGNETYAIFGKYNVNDSRFQRIIDQAPAHSYYHDALLDTVNNRIVLGGVLKAKDKNGRNGIPFIDMVDIKNETYRREELSSPDFKGAVLVTAIAPAPDYGFALTLSGIGETGYYDEPYMIVRINSQGKYIKEERK